MSPDIVFRTFDADILDTTLGKARIVHDVAYSAPGALRLEGLPGEDALTQTPVDLPCAIGSIVDLRFLFEETPLSGIAQVVNLRDGTQDFVDVRSVTADVLEVRGATGSAVELPAARGVWHDLRIETIGSQSTITLDDLAPVTVPSGGSTIPDLVTHAVRSVDAPLGMIIDDLRVVPILDRFFDAFLANTWTSTFPDPGEVAELRTNTYHSSPSSMYLESQDHDSNQGMGISHKLSMPMCLASRTVGFGANVWFNLPAGQPWGDAGFAFMHLLGDIPTPENDWTVPVIATVGDFNGDRKIDIRYPGETVGFDEEPQHTLVETGYPIPFGGWHNMDVLVRPDLSWIDVDTFPGITELPVQDAVFDVRLDGTLVGTFDAASTDPIMMAYMGTVYTRSWMSDDFQSYWDDFRVRLDLVAPLCSDAEKLYNDLTGELLLDRVWLDGDETLDQLRVLEDGVWIDVPETGMVNMTLENEGVEDIVVELITSSGIVLRDTCRLVRDTVAPASNLTDMIGRLGEDDWYQSAVDLVASADDTGTGVAFLEGALNGGPLRTFPGTTQIAEEGEHLFTFRAEDRAGNPEGVWHEVPLRIDLAAPTTTAADSNGTALDGAVSATGFTITLDAADSMSGVAQTWYSLNGGPLTTYTGAFVIDTPGTYVLEYGSTDVAGHQEATRTATFLIDAAPPTIALAEPATSDGWISAGTPLELAGSDDAQQVNELRWRMDGGEWNIVQGSHASVPAPVGDHVLEAVALTPDGSMSDVIQYAFRADGGAPALLVTQPSRGSFWSPVANGGVGGSNLVISVGRTITFAGTAADAEAGLASVDVYLDGAPVSTEGTDSWSALVRAPPGVHRVDVVAQDLLGHRTTETWTIWSVL